MPKSIGFFIPRVTKEHLPWDTKNKMLWCCPQCESINAWNSDDAERASKKLKITVEACHGSCFDNVCGHCGANIVKPDSPILTECYTHTEV